MATKKRKTTNRASKKRGKSGSSRSKMVQFSAIMVLVALIVAVVYYTSAPQISRGENSYKSLKESVQNVADDVKKIDVDEVLTTLKEKAKPQEPTQSEESTTEEVVEVNKDLSVKQPYTSSIATPYLDDTTFYYYNHDGRFGVYFSKKDKVPHWVAHILTRSEAKVSLVERAPGFKRDNHYLDMGIATASDSDYRKSGYDKGHMLPSADRNDTKTENVATFLFSNVAPQRPNLNRRTINMLEQNIRDWAIDYDTLYIVTGAILNSDRPLATIGNGVTVPSYFYKCIAAKVNGKYEMTAFLMPNTNEANSDFEKYGVTVDSVEKAAGVDLFFNLPDSQESRAESVRSKIFR